MLNRATFIGNLGADVDVRQMDSGTNVGNMRLATSEVYFDKDGNRKVNTQWHRVAYFGMSEKLATHLKKGRQILVTGSIEHRQYADEQGNTRYSTSLVIRPHRGGELRLLNRPKSEVSEQQQDEVVAEL
jgi:single-strand DNA-binding protein